MALEIVFFDGKFETSGVIYRWFAMARRAFIKMTKVCESCEL